ncbi:MAG: type II secretion system protein [Gemmatimonadota bacterium]
MARDGFTLLEAAVSLAILSVVALAALGAVQRDLDAAVRFSAALESAALAEDRLEGVRLLDQADLESLPDSVARGRFPAPLDGYRWTVEVVPVGDAPGLYDIAIEIAWDDGRRPLHARLFRPVAAMPTGEDDAADAAGAAGAAGVDGAE